MNINPVFELLRNDGSIIINKALMHRLGVNEAILYSEIVSRYSYFAKGNMLTEDYFYNTVDDLHLATALGEKAQNKAIKNLITLGLIDKKLKGTPARRHFKITDNMNLILSYIEEGKTIIKELDQKQKVRMQEKIQYSKFSSSEKAELEDNDNSTSNSSSSQKTELSKINSSSIKTEVVEKTPVPPIGSVQFLPKEVSSSSNKTEVVPAIGRINNTNNNTKNNTKNNREEDCLLSIWNNITIILKKEMTEVSFKTWIMCLSPSRIENDILILRATNDFTKSIVESKYRDILIKAISTFKNSSITNFIVEAE
ncbi:DnaA N-terminal domain-containing protein [Clostridium tagluense]|uniref:DnaA N-terminal domain-containing protein n=1 Tax=Clostridium tagluense TaxID=360422 RepID=A0A401UPE0_9CLOT|nr:DnaA N-terminal domain-containing protein [Clostridium tagluense]GCD11394.1 hypothetical protein Ctaglu_30170 [Clostridium tagluense]